MAHLRPFRIVSDSAYGRTITFAPDHGMMSNEALLPRKEAEVPILSFRQWGVVVITSVAVATFVSQAYSQSTRTVILVNAGVPQSITTKSETVADLLQDQHLILNPLDRVFPKLSSPITPGLRVILDRVRVEAVEAVDTIAYKTKRTYTDNLRVGTKQVIKPGQFGARISSFRDTYVNETRTSHIRLGLRTTAPVDAIVKEGVRGIQLASRGATAHRTITMIATGYSASENTKWQGKTATGTMARFGVVAVDPRFIKLGTRLYVEGYGIAIAADTGSAIKGRRIDLCFNTRSEAKRLGRKQVKVTILR